MENKELKKALYNHCEEFINSRTFRIKTNIEATQEALTSETKSSAGDKHETGRAMIHLEREKLGQQLAEAEKIKQALFQVQINGSIDRVGLGSLVYTTKENYFIGISAGQFKDIYCISAGTPIGKLLFGKSLGESFIFNKETITVVKIH